MKYVCDHTEKKFTKLRMKCKQREIFFSSHCFSQCYLNLFSLNFELQVEGQRFTMNCSLYVPYR